MGGLELVEKRIIWEELPCSEHGIDYRAFNRKEEYLGWLQRERIGRFMHYCWYQEPGIRMSPGCLQEVRDKQKELARRR